MDWFNIVTAAGALIAIILSLHKIGPERRKLQADASSAAVMAAAELVDDLRQEVGRLRDRLIGQEREIADQRKRIIELETWQQQAYERITVLETENERLQSENERLEDRLTSLLKNYEAGCD